MRDDAIAFGRVKSGAQGGRLAEVASEADAQNPRVIGGQLANHLPRVVLRAVVDDDHLQIVTVLLPQLDRARA